MTPPNEGPAVVGSGIREAGHGLDAEVHKALFGEVLPWGPLHGACACYVCGEQARYCGERAWCSTCSEWRYGPYPEYSTEIGPAFDLVSIMESRWWWFALETYPSPYDINEGETVHARFKGTNMPGQHDGEGMADSIPLAICLAALAALRTPERP